MARLEFKELSFEEHDGKIKASFLNNYYFYLNKEDLEKIRQNWGYEYFEGWWEYAV